MVISDGCAASTSGQLSARSRDGVHAATIPVVVHASHSYTIQIERGLLTDLPGHLTARWPGRRFFVLTDDRVEQLLAVEFMRGLREFDAQVDLVVIPQGESSKSLASLEHVVQAMNRSRLDRRGLVVNLGGGMIIDLGGFAASTYMRGIGYINVPTTLIAQHDAAIGGKVAVNTPWAKNFLGAFHHPEAVFADPDVLRTLNHRDLIGGVSEAIKVGLCGCPHLLDLLEKRSQQVSIDCDLDLLAEVVARASRRKTELLADDPYEYDLKRVLNLGHSVAHPLETEFGYEELNHGEAVGFGLALATCLARHRALLPDGTAERIFRLLLEYDLPPLLPRDRILGAMAHVEAIRRVRGQHLNFVLPVDWGAVKIVEDVSDDELRRAVDQLGSDPLVGSRILKRRSEES